MSATTSIEWTDRTWNPVRGCSVISPGCVNCYAMKQAHRFSAPGKPYHGLTKLTKAGPQWTGAIRTVDDALLEPLSWRKPARIFVNSMSDLFHEGVPDDFIDRVFAVMALAPRHTFQILTKRPRRMLDYFTAPIGFSLNRRGRVIGIAWEMLGHPPLHKYEHGGVQQRPWPLPNVWLGVSAEDQKHADERIPLLLQTPAAIRFVSYEPALGAADFRPYVTKRFTIHLCADVEGMLRNKSFDGLTGDGGRPLSRKEAEQQLIYLRDRGVRVIKASDECEGFSDQTGCPRHEEPRLDWVIAGGESGPHARPAHPDWFRSVRDQCQAAGVPFFFKQWGEFRRFGPDHLIALAGFNGREKKGGRELDGRTWDEFPTARSTVVVRM